MDIGSINAKLTASDAGFSSTLAKAQKQAQTFNAAVSGAVAGAVASISNRLMGGVSSGFAYIGKIAEEADAVRKSAQSIGVTTDALSSLQYTASLAGLGAEEVTDSLSRMQRVLGDAAAGSTSAKASVAGLGLSLDKLLSKSPIDAFGDIADALNALPTAAARASAANDIFGRSYAKMLPLLSGGSKGLADAADEAARLGVTTKQIDAENIEQFLDALTRVRAVVDGFVRNGFGLVIAGVKGVYESLAQLSPLLDTITSQILGVGSASNVFVNLPMRVATGVVAAVSVIKDLVTFASNGLGLVANSVLGSFGLGSSSDAATMTANSANALKGITDTITGFIPAADAAAKAMEEVAKAQNRVGEFQMPTLAPPASDIAGLSEVGRILDGLSNDLDSLTTSKLGMMVQQLTLAGASGDQLAQAVDLMNKADLTRFSNSVRDALKTPADAFAEMIDKLGEAVAQGFLTAEQAAAFAESKVTGTGAGRSEQPQSPGLLLANSAQDTLFRLNAGRKPVEDQQLVAQQKMVATLSSIDRRLATSTSTDYDGL